MRILELDGTLREIMPGGHCSTIVKSDLLGEMCIDLLTLGELSFNAVLNTVGELSIVLCQCMPLILYAHEHSVDIFPHILKSQSHVLATIIR